jgi:hypothetical protein
VNNAAHELGFAAGKVDPRAGPARRLSLFQHGGLDGQESDMTMIRKSSSSREASDPSKLS